jgi:hypothetical protein
MMWRGEKKGGCGDEHEQGAFGKGQRGCGEGQGGRGEGEGGHGESVGREDRVWRVVRRVRKRIGRL